MMGERTAMQEELFNGFSLEQHVPANHMLRAIDRFVDLSDIRQKLAPFWTCFTLVASILVSLPPAFRTGRGC